MLLVVLGLLPTIYGYPCYIVAVAYAIADVVVLAIALNVQYAVVAVGATFAFGLGGVLHQF